MTRDYTELVVERRVAASPATVFSFFADRDQWLRWQGVEADIDPRPGGLFRINVRGDGFASGRFVEIEPDRRIVFTWGWEMPGNPVAPGSSTVEIDLIPDGGETIIRLIHRGLPAEAFELHREGWEHYIGRLAGRAAGKDPGPDPAVLT
jgi:uncharacterized protein YndB with AHSA1/START domain